MELINFSHQDLFWWFLLWRS